MKRAPVSYRRPNWPKEKFERIREIERDFHIRQFGEELARVNFELTIQERHQYLAWMREAARKGKTEPPGV
jgi:hypothetical protein